MSYIGCVAHSPKPASGATPEPGEQMRHPHCPAGDAPEREAPAGGPGRITLAQALAIGDMDEALTIDVELEFRRAVEEALAEED